MSKVKLVDVVDKFPKCPYCNQEMETIERTHAGILGATVVYMCPHCQKLLSIGVNG
jgi:uncharacterized protein with PIN domain